MKIFDEIDKMDKGSKFAKNYERKVFKHLVMSEKQTTYQADEKPAAKYPEGTSPAKDKTEYYDPANPPPEKKGIFSKFASLFKPKSTVSERATQLYEQKVKGLPISAEEKEAGKLAIASKMKEYEGELAKRSMSRAVEESKYGLFPSAAVTMKKLGRSTAEGYREIVGSITQPASIASDRMDALLSGGIIGPIRPTTEESMKAKEQLELFKNRMMIKYGKKYNIQTFNELLPRLNTREQAAYVNLRNKFMEKERAASLGGFMGGRGTQIIQQSAHAGSQFIEAPQFATQGVSMEKMRGFTYRGEYGGMGSEYKDLSGINPQISGILTGASIKSDFGGKINSIIGLRDLPGGMTGFSASPIKERVGFDEDKIRYFAGLKR